MSIFDARQRKCDASSRALAMPSDVGGASRISFSANSSQCQEVTRLASATRDVYKRQIVDQRYDDVCFLIAVEPLLFAGCAINRLHLVFGKRAVEIPDGVTILGFCPLGTIGRGLVRLIRPLFQDKIDLRFNVPRQFLQSCLLYTSRCV